MNREIAKKFAPLLTALANGQKLQKLSGLGNQWYETDEILFNEEYTYRIKPTPTLRPWRAEEVPLHAVFRSKNHDFHYRFFRLSFMTNDGRVGFVGTDTNNNYDYRMWNTQCLLSSYEHSLDHGHTWLPCGVKEY